MENKALEKAKEILKKCIDYSVDNGGYEHIWNGGICGCGCVECTTPETVVRIFPELKEEYKKYTHARPIEDLKLGEDK